MQPTIPQPVFLNVEYFFYLVARFFAYIFSPQFLETARNVLSILSIVLVALIAYLLVRLYEIKSEEKKQKSLAEVPLQHPGGRSVNDFEAVPRATDEKFRRNETWENIRTKLLSDNQSDWRLAIIEADIYMDRLLDGRGFHGETTSDKLKQITSHDMASIQIAWEAHKVRNRIAHEGAAFTLTQPEARRILSQFEIVFRDLEAIE